MPCPVDMDCEPQHSELSSGNILSVIQDSDSTVHPAMEAANIPTTIFATNELKRTRIPPQQRRVPGVAPATSAQQQHSRPPHRHIHAQQRKQGGGNPAWNRYDALGVAQAKIHRLERIVDDLRGQLGQAEGHIDDLCGQLATERRKVIELQSKVEELREDKSHLFQAVCTGSVKLSRAQHTIGTILATQPARGPAAVKRAKKGSKRALQHTAAALAAQHEGLLRAKQMAMHQQQLHAFQQATTSSQAPVFVLPPGFPLLQPQMQCMQQYP